MSASFDFAPLKTNGDRRIKVRESILGLANRMDSRFRGNDEGGAAAGMTGQASISSMGCSVSPGALPINQEGDHT